MTVMGIMLFLGLLGTFLGVALLSMERKERKAFKAKEQEEQAAAAAQEEGELHLVKEGEEQPIVSAYRPNINRLKLGYLFTCQGSLAAIAAIGLFFINGYVVKIAWYITLPVAIAYFGICLVMDALLMAPKGETQAQEGQDDEQAPQEDAPQEEPSADEAESQSNQENLCHPERNGVEPRDE